MTAVPARNVKRPCRVSLRSRRHILFWWGALHLATAAAAPYTPASDQEVLLRAPLLPSDTLYAPLLSEETQTLADDERMRRAGSFLQDAFEHGNETAFDLARAMLQSWWTSPAANTPPAASLMKAMILQHYHEFDLAIAELDFLLEQNPRLAQAHLVRAQIFLASGQYARADADCQALGMLTRSALAVSCMAQVQGLTGGAQTAYRVLDAMLQSEMNTTERTELLLTQAGIAHRLGMAAAAEAAYLQVLAANAGNSYALLSYADLLAEQDRTDAVRVLLEYVPENQRSLEVVVRLWEAATRLGLAAASDYRVYLDDSFALARQRADAFPQKEYARYLLSQDKLSNDALQAAQLNWSRQKEPSDLLLLIRAASAVHDGATLRQAQLWVEETGLEDVRVARLLSALEP